MNDEMREQELARIRETYAGYERGRVRLWDSSNRGYARIAQERDARLIELIRQSLPPDGQVLDAGSGVGTLAAVAKGAGIEASWTGIDLLESSVTLARATHPWATWIVGSADELPFEDQAFDVIVASTLFSSLPSRRLEHGVAREIGRVVRRGGWIVWYDLRLGSPRNPAVHGLSTQDVERLFPDWPLDLEPLTLLPPVARRLGPLTRIFYPGLSLLTPLRSHLVGRIRRPD